MDNNIRIKSSLNAKFSMPVFDENDEEELRRMSAGEDWDIPEFADNIKKKPKINEEIPKAEKPTKSPYAVPKPTSSSTVAPKKPTIPRPNLNWRSALTISSSLAKSVEASKKQKPESFDDIDDGYVDLDYDDFERAMREVEMGGLNPGGVGSKQSTIPTEHNGLKSGEVLPSAAWKALVNAEGEDVPYPSIIKENDVIIVFADPRRLTDEFRIILDEFKKVPMNNLRVSLLAVNCDVPNDHRKFLKKNTLSFPLLADPTKAFMDAAKCRAKNRLSSALLLLEASSGRVLKIWYENDWDVMTTKDMILEEIKEYRADPKMYVQSQIGIR
eukprot:gene5626-11354_t